MGRRKEVRFYNDRYQGSLDAETCEKLDQIIELDKNNGVFTDLRHIVYELSDYDTGRILANGDAQGIDDIDYKRGTLRPEQTLGTAFMFFAKNCILGDSVGLGKTVETAALCMILSNIAKTNGDSFHYLFLTNKNLVEQTRFKLTKFTGEFVETLYGDKIKCTKFAAKYTDGANLPQGVVGGHTLLNQGAFLAWVERARIGMGKFPFDLIVIDESSVLGNSATGITKNASILLPLTQRVIFLNATPFETKLDTFYTQLNLVDPELLPTKTNFQKEYVIMDYSTGLGYGRPSGKYKNAAKFRQLVGYRYFARTRREKGAVMEGCTSKLLYSPVSDIQKYLLSRTEMPQLVYDCPTALDNSIAFEPFNVPKLASLAKILEDDCQDSPTILIFVHYKIAQQHISNWLSAKGYSNRVLCGETPDKVRQEVIDGFKNFEFRVLITNVQKGLDFGDCNHCIFYGFNPNPSNMVQFEGRITRSFDIVDKHIYLLCSEGKEKERLEKVIKERAKASSEFVNMDLSCIMDLLLADG